jgi:hypothetical protein
VVSVAPPRDSKSAAAIEVISDGNLADQPIADGQLRIGLKRLADRHRMHEYAGGQPDEQVDQRDDQAGDGVALDEFGRTVQRAEKADLALFADTARFASSWSMAPEFRSPSMASCLPGRESSAKRAEPRPSGQSPW